MKSSRLSLMVFAWLYYFTGFLTVHAADNPDGSLGDILKPWVNLLNCDQGSPEVRLLCKLVSTQVNTKLAAAGLSITKDGTLFSYDDQTNKDIPTGHGCTVTAKIKRSRASVRLDASASVDLSGNPLSGAGLMAVVLPVELSANVNVQEKFGVQAFGCQNIGSDSFEVSGSISTVGRIWIFFALAPSLRIDKNGDYVLTIKPITDVIAKLQDTQVNAHISGVSPYNGIATLVLTLPLSTVQLAVYLHEGSMSPSAWLQFPKDLVIGTVMSLPSPLINELLSSIAKEAVKKQLKGQDSKYSGQLKDRLAAAVAKALQLDARGERHFVIRKNVVSLIEQYGFGADVWLPTKPPGYCASNRDCDDGVYCNGAERCVSEQCVAGTPPCGESTSEQQIICVESQKKCIFKALCGPGHAKSCP